MRSQFGNIKRAALVSLLPLFFNHAIALDAPKTSVAELELKNSEGQNRLALLVDTEVFVDIVGMVATIRLRQTFKNDSEDWVNGRYLLPVTETAAVDALTISLNDREITGVVQEKKIAEETYENAKQAGKTAGLLRQQRPNMFSLDVANIAPQESIIADVSLVTKVRFNDGQFSLRLPTTITPRYIPGAPLALTEEFRDHLETQLNDDASSQVNQFGWARPTRAVPDADQITPSQISLADVANSHHFSLSMSLNAGMNVAGLMSENHSIARRTQADGTELIELAVGKAPMDKDLVVRWNLAKQATPNAALLSQKVGDNYYSLFMATPPTITSSLALPRDVIFIIDSSGSMAGASMPRAQEALLKALAHLSERDRFNIVDFDSDYRPLFDRSRQVSQTSLRQARKMVNRLSADGGTEMYGALKFALDHHSDLGYLKQIIFITDGAIGNEGQLFELIEKRLAHARLFTVGIGGAPNSHFMNKAAKFGRGTHTYINQLALIENRMSALFSQIAKPLMRDLSLHFSTEVEQYPRHVPDLYAGEPLVVLLKSSRPLDSVKVKGRMLNSPWARTVNAPPIKPSSTHLDKLWAREKIESLTDDAMTGAIAESEVKQRIIELSLAHQVASKFAAFVAVDNVVRNPSAKDSKTKSIANLLPAGSKMVTPNTATGKTLSYLLGIVLLLLAWASTRPVGKNLAQRGDYA